MLVISYIREHRDEVIERLSIKNFTNVELIDEINELSPGNESSETERPE